MADSIVFNTRERAISGDWNDVQTLGSRVLLELMRRSWESRVFSFGGTVGEAPRSVVAGGLQVSPSGSDVVVSAGVLVMDSATVPAAPEPLESQYRIATLLSPLLVTAPAPGSDTWYLLEAQPDDVVASTQTRDIWDTGGGVWVPTSVPKRTERRVTTQWVTGTSTQAPAPSGADWIPLAIVFRPAGGGAVLPEHVLDARRIWDSLDAQREIAIGVDHNADRHLATVSVPDTASSSIHLAASARINGQRLWFFNNGPFDPTGAGYRDPSYTVAANGWAYLYLVPWQGLAIVDTRRAAQSGKGVLMLSNVAPFAGTTRNSAALTLPAPFGVATVGANGAVCVGALRRNAANTGWIWALAASGTRRMRCAPITVPDLTAAPIASPLTVDLAGLVPATAKTALVRLGVEPNGTAGVFGLFTTVPVGVTAGEYEWHWNDEGTWRSVDLEIPLTFGLTFDLRYTLGTVPPNTQGQIIGWTE